MVIGCRVDCHGVIVSGLGVRFVVVLKLEVELVVV